MIFVLLLAGTFTICLLLAYRNGRQDMRGEERDKNDDALDKAALTRDRLRHDAAYAERVRKRFSR